MLIVTHEMSFARDIADRVIFMEAGRVVEDTVFEGHHLFETDTLTDLDQ